MNEVDFRLFAGRVFDNIVEQIEMQDIGYHFDIDNDGDGVWVNTDKGQYVMNIQTSKREVWLSSPISGPYHFVFIDGDWIDKGGDSLCHVLSDELTSISKQEIIIKNLVNE